MLWTWSPSSWAPSLVVTVQSQPAYLIETVFYCTVGFVACIALLLTAVVPRPAARVATLCLGNDVVHASAVPETPREVLEAAAAAVDFPPAVDGKQAKGDGDSVPSAASKGGCPNDGVQDGAQDGDANEQVLSVCSALEAPDDNPTATCAAGRGRCTEDNDLDPVATEDAVDYEDAILVEVDSDSSSLSESSDEEGRDAAAVPLAGEGEAANAAREATEDQHDMVEYVTARYRGFKQATRTGQLFAVDPRPSSTTRTAFPETDLVTVLSHALRHARAAGPTLGFLGHGALGPGTGHRGAYPGPSSAAQRICPEDEDVI